MNIQPENTTFVVLSFEGPDPYSMAGGLGVRTGHLTRTLAGMGFPVHHIFVGDPHAKPTEARVGGKLVFHRWCQWISGYHPRGVYDGEEGKLYDFNESLPPFVVRELAAPAISRGRLVAILCEEWHTAEAACRISDLLHFVGLRNRAVIFWNANNTYGFDRIDWPRLSYTTAITAVSKYMKQILRARGVEALVIPNGIPRNFLKKVDDKHVSHFRESLAGKLVLSKVARWDPHKGWEPAVDAVHILKKAGLKPVLIARGGIEPYGGSVMERARGLGLSVRDVGLSTDSQSPHFQRAGEAGFAPYFEAIARAASADMLNLRFPIHPSFLKVIYRASDAVLANSAHEPFGLVGLEAMAAGTVAFVGCSGEDYAIHRNNAIVLSTPEGEEIGFYLQWLKEHPEEKENIRKAARKTAEWFTWGEVVKHLIGKIEYQAGGQGANR